MKKLGWVLGGMYLIDGIVDLFGGERAMNWMQTSMAEKLPASWGNRLRQMTDLNPTALRTVGVINVVGGLGMVLLAATAGRQPAKKRWRLRK